MAKGEKILLFLGRMKEIDYLCVTNSDMLKLDLKKAGTRIHSCIPTRDHRQNTRSNLKISNKKQKNEEQGRILMVNNRPPPFCSKKPEKEISYIELLALVLFSKNTAKFSTTEGKQTGGSRFIGRGLFCACRSCGHLAVTIREVEPKNRATLFL